MTSFQEVPSKPDFPAMEREILAWWTREEIMEAYLNRNKDASETWSFIDGPITANNPMGVHHGWGRTYKDLFQRFQTMLGKEQRYQNGFDCQGLWVEVEVEKELGLKSKRDIETYGIAEFVNRCKERVWKYAKRITDQSIRLGYWMDWDNSYYTMSDENNYTIWHFLKQCHDRGWIYKGHDSMPWCPRCGTGISEHEIVTEGYQDRTHLSLFVGYPIVERPGEELMVWTTTPWTLAANVAAAVNTELTYVRLRQGDRIFYVGKDAISNAIKGDYEILDELPGKELLGLTFRAPYDDFPANAGVRHVVIPWDDVSAVEGTGIVHIAPGAGKEDFQLSKVNDLDVIAPLNESGIYMDGFDWLTGQYVHDVATPIMRDLEKRGFLYRSQQYTHRYPVCWRCGTDLAFRLVDEWFISMDELREPMMRVTKEINWVPGFGRERELDWLAHMDDWMISKKRYWGLALPIYECESCGAFEVIGSEDELKSRAVEGWDEFEGHSPHRPWIDGVKIACQTCGSTASRIKDVGNPWLDAGIVAFSTLSYRSDKAYWEKWYPADLISESFPGQFRNWFYSVIAQSTALADRPAFRNVFSYALMRDEKGEEMHKSKGNAIWFDDAADQIGVDTMRWLYTSVNPSHNLNFGYKTLDEIRRQFILPFWNSYSFFVTYARLDGFDPTDAASQVPLEERTLLDRWIVSRQNQLIETVRESLLTYRPEVAAQALEKFVVEELSNWYIRRNRRRFWKSEADRDKAAAYRTLYDVLVTTIRLLAPFIPFLTDEMYRNLVASVDASAPASVHLTDFPMVDAAQIDETLSRDMAVAMEIVALGRSARSESNLKVRQPLAGILVYTRDADSYAAAEALQDLILDELNIKSIAPLEELGEVVSYGIRPNLSVLGPRLGRQLGEVRGLLTSMDPAAVAQAVNAGNSVELTLKDGWTVALEPQEILVDLVKRPGYAAAQGEIGTIVLDTEITEELLHEGIARDFVRGVQDARKSAGYQIDDRIEIAYTAPAAVAAAIEAFGGLIQNETLAESLQSGEASSGNGSHTAAIEAGGQPVAIALRPVAR
ncbi:MAG: isoleucine--tRNA ligase [Thermomicrobiales bacterium]|nr:isoleucine--tRNA ligase [Thermomicrobiales bacterium]